MAHHNIVLFGETGSGKSSLINMLLGFDAANTSSAPRGCTFRSTAYNTTFNNTSFTLHDTSGLDEGEQGRVPHADAVVQLYSLMKNLQDGVSLLIFVMKSPARIRDSTTKNWKLFTKIICRDEVPAAVIITGLEQEPDIDAWWPANQAHFENNEICPSLHACVTAIRGRRRANGTYSLQEEYDESRAKVQRMISTAHRYHPWNVQPIQWLNRVVYETYYVSRKWRSPIEKQRAVDTIRGAVEDMVQKCGMPREEAMSLATKLSVFDNQTAVPSERRGILDSCNHQ